MKREGGMLRIPGMRSMPHFVKATPTFAFMPDQYWSGMKASERRNLDLESLKS